MDQHLDMYGFCHHVSDEDPPLTFNFPRTNPKQGVGKSHHFLGPASVVDFFLVILKTHSY